MPVDEAVHIDPPSSSFGSGTACRERRRAHRALAGWRARDLLMAGRLRPITARYPGGRVLAIVGYAHKGPLEAALATDQWDVEIVEVSELDRPASA